LVRIVLLALLVIATAACGAYRFPGAGAAGTGTVSGQVTVVPCAPIEPTTQPCKIAPASGLEIDFGGAGTTVTAHTDANGQYSVELPAGTWKVSFKGYLRIIKGPPMVTVNPGSNLVADFVVDSGIRVSG
jgi:type 1 fimbria pilin